MLQLLSLSLYLSLSSLIQFSHVHQLELDKSLLGQGKIRDMAPLHASLLHIDGTAAMNLELLETIDMKQQGSLFSVLNHCQTAFGKYKLVARTVCE